MCMVIEIWYNLKPFRKSHKMTNYGKIFWHGMMLNLVKHYILIKTHIILRFQLIKVYDVKLYGSSFFVPKYEHIAMGFKN